MAYLTDYFTSAPPDYDYRGTETRFFTPYADARGRVIRHVWIPEERLLAQKTRYASGLYLCIDGGTFRSCQAQPFLLKPYKLPPSLVGNRATIAKFETDKKTLLDAVTLSMWQRRDPYFSLGARDDFDYEGLPGICYQDTLGNRGTCLAWVRVVPDEFWEND